MIVSKTIAYTYFIVVQIKNRVRVINIEAHSKGKLHFLPVNLLLSSNSEAETRFKRLSQKMWRLLQWYR